MYLLFELGSFVYFCNHIVNACFWSRFMRVELENLWFQSRWRSADYAFCCFQFLREGINVETSKIDRLCQGLVFQNDSFSNCSKKSVVNASSLYITQKFWTFLWSKLNSIIEQFNLGFRSPISVWDSGRVMNLFLRIRMIQQLMLSIQTQTCEILQERQANTLFQSLMQSLCRQLGIGRFLVTARACCFSPVWCPPLSICLNMTLEFYKNVRAQTNLDRFLLNFWSRWPVLAYSKTGFTTLVPSGAAVTLADRLHGRLEIYTRDGGANSTKKSDWKSKFFCCRKDLSTTLEL